MGVDFSREKVSMSKGCEIASEVAWVFVRIQRIVIKALRRRSEGIFGHASERAQDPTHFNDRMIPTLGHGF